MSAQRWRTVEELRAHLDLIVRDLGRMPTKSELNGIGRSDIASAIQKFGGYRTVADLLGYPRQDQRAWETIEDLRTDLDPIVTQLGRMPNRAELAALAPIGLREAIRKRGGYFRVAVVLGYPYESRKIWDTVEDLKPYLDPIVAEVGRMPLKSELERSGRHDLVGAITRFGGLRRVAELLDYRYAERAAAGGIEDLRTHLDPLVAQIGRMPNLSELRTFQRSDLAPHIKRLGGSLKVASKLGYPRAAANPRPPPHRTAQVSDLRTELDPIVTKLGHMPNNLELQDMGLGGLRKRIQRFGGVRQVSERLGYPYAGPHSWRNIEDLRIHLDPFVEELDRMPTATELVAKGRVDLTGAIRTHGGFPVVARALGYPHSGRRTWDSIDDLQTHLDPIVEELQRMPTEDALSARNRSDLIHGIRKFGGFPGVAKKLGYPFKESETWENVEQLRPHLAPIVAELGRLPIQRELKARGRIDLVGAIQKFGGQSRVARELGYPYHGRRHWQSSDELRAELDPLVAALGRMPTIAELSSQGLQGAIQQFGGAQNVAKALGYLYIGPKTWNLVEDLRPHLDPLVAELGRMPGQLDLKERGRMDLVGAISKFGGFPRVAELLAYPYAFAPALSREARVGALEFAILDLHESQMLSAGQVMLILRHAGLLSTRCVIDIVRRLPMVERTSSAPSGSDHVGSSVARFLDAEEAGGTTCGENRDDPLTDNEASDGTPPVSLEPASSYWDDTRHGDEPVTAPGTPDQSRDRAAEVKELRGWSHLGNLLDPAPALVQLSVTRLKSAFYCFANEVRGSLKAPANPPSPEQVEQLKVELWEAAFGEYGELIDNDLVRAACDAYVADLASALLVPRREMAFVPRLYQLDGARFIAERVRSDDRPFGLLFDQPGMGKTLTTLWGLAAGGATRAAIVAPLTVKRQVWTPETIRQAFPHLGDDRIATGLDAALVLPPEEPAVALLHYEELRRHDAIRRLATPRADGSPPFDVLVLDEAHEVKERLSTASRGPTREGAWLLRTGARACVGLTATPVVNELFEPVSLLHLVQGRRDTDAGRRLQSRRLRDRVDVMEYLLADSLRRLKPDVLFEIPPRDIRVHEVVPDAELLGWMRAFLGRGRRRVAAQLADYRRLVLEAKLDWIAGAVRANASATRPEELPDPKTLVLCYNVEGVSRRVYARLVGELGPDRVLHVDGSTPQSERAEALRRFRESADVASGVAVLVGSVGTIGVGITLFDPEEPVTPHRVIFADLPYTWAEFEQGVDRLHRVGQRFPVTIDVPVVTFGEQLIQADGEPLESFDQWVWGWIRRKQVLADQVLDAAFDVSEYKDAQIRKAIAQSLKAVEEAGGAVIAPAPPPDSPAAEHRRAMGRLRGMPRERATEVFREAGASERFLAVNDALPSARLAQRLVRERLGRWLDRRSVVVDLGCGSNPLRDLPCERVVGVDRHGVNGGLIGDSADTGLATGEADFVVMSLSVWGTPADRLAYLREAKRLLRPLGKLIVVEPVQAFGDAGTWQAGAARFGSVVERLGMRLAEAREYAVDEGASLLAFVVDNSSAPAADDVAPHDCAWTERN